jgi:hypothetical protein
MRTCSINGCFLIHYGKSLCRKHYERFKRYGDPEAYFPNRKKLDFTVNENGCFECNTLTINSHGYPMFMKDNRRYVASRIVYEEMFGEIPKSHVIRHTCDNPKCINPEHLITGTQKQNMADKIERGRNNPPVGERSSRAKLNEKQVREIRSFWESGMDRHEIGKRYGIMGNTVWLIGTKKRWKHLK